MINKKYFDTYELGARKKIREWNDKSHLFDSITDYPRNYFCDFSGTCKGHNVNIEVKDRNLNLLSDGRISGATKTGKEYIDDTIFIESHKACDLIFDYIATGSEPLYFNFLNDDYVALFNLKKLTKRPKEHKRLSIESKGYQKMEIGSREGLYIKDAAIYKDGKLIKRMGEDWNGSE